MFINKEEIKMKTVEKPEKYKVISCRMDKEAWFDLKLIALTTGTQMGEIIRTCIEKYIKANKGKVRLSNE